MTVVGVVVVNDDEPRMHNRRNEGDGTSKNRKKKKELVFLGGVLLVNFDDRDIPNKRLLCNSKDIDEEEALNREDMDVDISTPSCA